MRTCSGLRRGRAARGVSGLWILACVSVACTWEPASVGQSYRGEGRISVLDDDSVGFEAEVELVLRATRAQSVALDEVCVVVGSADAGTSALAQAAVEGVELDPREWPVELSEANGFEARRRLRLRGTAAMKRDSTAHPCRVGAPVIRMGASLLSSEMFAEPTKCRVEHSEITVELECPGCPAPLPELGLASTWEEAADVAAPIAGSTVVVDAEGTIWRVGPSGTERALLMSSPDDAAVAERRVTDANFEMRGRVTLAGGTVPGVLRGHAVGEPYFADAPPEPTPEGEGGGSSGEEPPPTDPMRRMRVARVDAGGERWARDFETYAYDVDLVAPVVAAATGKVLVVVYGPRGLYVDGEMIAPKSSTEVHLALLDEQTGELLDFIEFEHPLYSAQGLSDGAFIASAGVQPGIFALLRIEADLQVSWLTPLPEEPLEYFGMGPELLSIDGAAGYWLSPRGPLHRFDHAGEGAWRIDPPVQITSMAIAPDGGLLFAGPSHSGGWIDPLGGLRTTIDQRDDPTCAFQLSLATAGREPAYALGFGSRHVGRFRAAR